MLSSRSDIVVIDVAEGAIGQAKDGEEGGVFERGFEISLLLTASH